MCIGSEFHYVALFSHVLSLVLKTRMNWKKGNHQFIKFLMLKIWVEGVVWSLKSFAKFSEKQMSNFHNRNLSTFAVQPSFLASHFGSRWDRNALSDLNGGQVHSWGETPWQRARLSFSCPIAGSLRNLWQMWHSSASSSNEYYMHLW